MSRMGEYAMEHPLPSSEPCPRCDRMEADERLAILRTLFNEAMDCGAIDSLATDARERGRIPAEHFRPEYWAGRALVELKLGEASA